MILAVHHKTFFLFGEHFYYGIGAVVAIISLAKITGLTKWLKTRWNAYRTWRLLYSGRAEVSGVAPEVLPLARRLVKMDKNIQANRSAIADSRAAIERLDEGQLAIIKRFDTFLDSDFKTLAATVADTNRKVGLLFENGLNSNMPGDLLARLAQATPGAYLDHPSPIVHDRRGDDVPPKP